MHRVGHEHASAWQLQTGIGVVLAMLKSVSSWSVKHQPCGHRLLYRLVGNLHLRLKRQKSILFLIICVTTVFSKSSSATFSEVCSAGCSASMLYRWAVLRSVRCVGSVWTMFCALHPLHTLQPGPACSVLASISCRHVSAARCQTPATHASQQSRDDGAQLCKHA